jgi:propionyl-CoA synthetase
MGEREMDAKTASRYHEVYAQWQRDPEGFWAEAAKEIDWFEPADKVFDPAMGVYGRWFAGAKLQHLLQRARPACRARPRRSGGADLRFARHRRRWRPTYEEMLFEVATLAAILQDFGVGKGDRVILYMPMVPEAVFAMLACARIGAVHSVVFGGFAAKELAKRIDDAKPKVILSASCGIEPGRVVPTSRCSTRRSRWRSSSPPPASCCSGRRNRRR